MITQVYRVSARFVSGLSQTTHSDIFRHVIFVYIDHDGVTELPPFITYRPIDSKCRQKSTMIYLAKSTEDLIAVSGEIL